MINRRKFGVYTEEEIEQMHKEILWPTVRIAAKNAWGSGTLIYSKPDGQGKYHSYVLTCHHVIEDNIIVKSKFDQKVGFDIKKETRIPVEVQFFHYENLSICRGSAGSCKADIVCYDEDADIALLELQRTTEEGPVAYLLPKDKVSKVHIFDKVWACGAAMAHEPITTEGIINFMNEPMEWGIEYWMSNAQIIFGNSGGSVFRFSPTRDRFEFLGMPARIVVNITGFSPDAITHMGFFVPITKIFKLLDKHFYSFIYDGEKTYEECKELREKDKERQMKILMARYGGSPLKEKKKEK